ncbi:hypothetical protein J1N35_041013 [Gossypium stocksii]|uniref:Uncharacterized protein n=1 Tax=Gossypium stocksii TaxID=47602 RepID=A0A9D3UET8_9ROSI|nr:hypothetical protein J1N35_041013 [Gossypium stocksii]
MSLKQTDRLRPRGTLDKSSSPVTSGIQAIGYEGTIGMSKEEFGHKWAKKPILMKEKLSALEKYVNKLEESMKDIKESLDVVEDHIDDWKDQFRDYVNMSLNSTIDKVNE